MSIARLDFTDGRYAAALPFAMEAEAALRDQKEFSTLWIEALGLHARLLERLDRKTEALSVFEAADGQIVAAFGAHSNVAAAARLDRVGFLVDAGKVEEARALLKPEAERQKATGPTASSPPCSTTVWRRSGWPNPILAARRRPRANPCGF